ncbi:hypothetical protein GP486_001535 [Trichoglossum hirsutum]|uniref:Uncharacterized protein n=1 Tax=Trichoglossum hirsutum TaxID=265104 RepID=A0A9P8RSI9_9PEZI|nr:hypothetical protein GP486_001535 [Trichoglossum hirsutum]
MDKPQNKPGSYPGGGGKKISWTHSLAGGGPRSGDLDIFGIGGQFTNAQADLPQHLSFDESDDLGGSPVSNGEAFFANLSRNVSEISLQERENDHSMRSLNVEGIGGMSTAHSETCVETQNEESSHDRNPRNQVQLTPSGGNPNPPQTVKPTPNATHPIILPEPSRYNAFNSFFREYRIVLGIFLTVIIPVAAGAIAGTLKENLIVGILAGSAFFLLDAIIFALLWKREAKEAKEAKPSNAVTAEEAGITVEPRTMV